jgi:hypothetical protein
MIGRVDNMGILSLRHGIIQSVGIALCVTKQQCLKDRVFTGVVKSREYIVNIYK